MHIGLCYDTKEDYGFSSENMDYTDFATLSTVTDIRRAFSQTGHTVEIIQGLDNIKALIMSQMPFDIIFNIAEGFGSRNREGLIPAILEAYNIPFTGSDAYALSLTLNKLHTKIIAEYLGIITPKHILIHSKTEIKKVEEELIYPIVIKPNAEGGSMGVYKVHNQTELIDSIDELLNKYYCDILCEQFIEGIEITAPVIGNGESSKCIGVTAVQYSNGDNIGIYSSNLKYFGDIILTTDFDCDQNIKQIIMDQSEHLHKFLKLKDYSRVDFRLGLDGIPYFLEVNPLPALDREDTFEVCGQTLGLEYHEVLNLIIAAAAKRYKLLI